MASAYTPGLKIVGKTLVEKDRRLPMLGKVHVKKGDKVTAEDVVASTDLPGNVYPLNLANMLGCEAKEINLFLVKKEGDEIAKDEIIAETQGLFGFFKTQIKAPITGTIESLSDATGQAILREPPIPVEVNAYVDGFIDDVYEDEGVKVDTVATFVQGIFGIGPEAIGELEMVAQSPSDILNKEDIKIEHKNKIIVGGSLVTADALSRAVEVGAAGVVVGGYDANDLKEFLGYDLGVAITGTEEKGITLVVTEGFGQINMAQKTFDLLKNCEGKKTSINGATQIRAGVMRPEVVIPIEGASIDSAPQVSSTGMQIGSMVRIIREPHFGEVAKVVNLPEKPTKIPSEAKVRVVEIETLKGGEKMVLPRANVEIIEE
ncbi:MAG: hypothetical protein ACQETH_00840 [Candidatus Rifleibacteriota bacterium]